eukprot:TRINITY_DN16690_c0_g1_i2.p1 TRINITY_DN16690_c0_g1~~TRINITY_DN16690_c0_g1_i2.p1  ORF type:complete len:774 (+),score=174.28 TRINITY_DN16690_c0_g1_i2:140-2461(+)
MCIRDRYQRRVRGCAILTSSMRVLALLLLGLSGASCAVVGLDMGSSFIKVGVGRHGHGVQMALNEASKRKTPTAVGFHPEGPRRVWGDDALNLMNRHPGLSLPFPNVFLGESFGSDAVSQHRVAHPGYQLEQHGTRGSVLLGTKLGEMNQSVVPAEAAVGMLLQYAVQNIALEKRSERTADGVVITVPGCSTVQSRQAMQHAALLAGIPLLSLMNDHAAVALRYAMDQKFDSRPRYVMFFDMGGGGTKVSITAFHTVSTKDDRRKAAEQVVVKAVAFDSNLGGRAFDNVVAELLVSEATTQLSVRNVTLSARAKTRLHTAAEKARKVLSANKEYYLSVDSLTEDFDLRMELTRAKFENSASKLFDLVLSPVKAVLAQASQLHGIELSDIHSVELVGGAYRMPLVQGTLSEFFGKDRLKVSLNGDEAAALGATFYAAALKGYNVRPFSLVDLSSYSVQVRVDSKPIDLLVNTSSQIPVVKSITIPAETSRIEIVELESSNKWIADVSSSNTTSSLLIGIDRSGLPSIQGLHRFISHQKKVGPPIWTRESLNVSGLTPTSTFSPDHTETSTNLNILTWWQRHDDDYRARSEAQNQLESYLFSARDALESEEIINVSTEPERSTLTNAIETADEWLLSGEASSASEFQTQQGKVTVLLSALEIRVKELQTRPIALTKAKETVVKVNNVLSKLRDLPVANDTVVANATAADVSKLGEAARKFDEWVLESEKAQAELSVDQHPAVLSADLDTRTKDLLVLAASVATRSNLTAVAAGKK